VWVVAECCYGNLRLANCASYVANKSDEAAEKYSHGGQSVTDSLQWLSTRFNSRRARVLPPQQPGVGDAVNGGVSAREVGG
jgi:hypothetical protein